MRGQPLATLQRLLHPEYETGAHIRNPLDGTAMRRASMAMRTPASPRTPKS